MPAIVSGFREAGYKIDDDLQSSSTKQELLRAMEAKSDVARYNVYRLLNYIYKTHFDLERVFLGGKYALSFIDPNQEKQQNEKRLREYWQKRLKSL